MHADDRTADLGDWRQPRSWSINSWGLVRGLVLLASSFIVVAVLHRVVLVFFRG